MTFTVHAIDPARLDRMRSTGTDEHGNPFTAYPALGWEPLRCCLSRATEGESIVLIGFTRHATRSPWAETGPVYVHAERCAGYDPTAGLPAQYRTGPRVLRGYHADRSLDYDHVVVVGAGVDLEPDLQALLDAGVPEVHVRARDTQCFTYAVRS